MKKKKLEIVPQEMSAFMELLSGDVETDIPEFPFHTNLISGWLFKKKMARQVEIEGFKAEISAHQSAALSSKMDKTLKVMTFMSEYQKKINLDRIEVEREEICKQRDDIALQREGVSKQFEMMKVQLVQIEANDRLLEFTHKEKELADGNTETTDSSD